MLCLVAAFSLSSSAADLDRPIPKQLAGPPSEFPLMNVAEPVNVQSPSAMLPVTFEADAEGTLRWQGSFPVAHPEGLRLLLLHNDTSWDVTLTRPQSGKAAGHSVRLEELRPDVLETTVGAYSGDLVTFDAAMEVGRWGISITVPNDSPSPAQGFVVVGDDRPYLLDAGITTSRLVLGQAIGLTAVATRSQREGSSDLTTLWDPASTEEGAPALLWAHAIVQTPTGREITLRLADDGRHGDGDAGDGIFGGSFIADEIGTFTTRVVAEGATTADDVPFLRSTQHVFPVFSNDLELTAAAASLEPNNQEVAIDLSLASASGLADKVYAYAQVWGRSPEGKAEAVAWIGGIRYVDEGSISLRLDTRWIQRAAARGPFELREVRIQDVETFVPLLEVPTLSLRAEGLSGLSGGISSAVQSSTIDEEMRMGPRPRGLEASARGLASGSRLLLVHGYCSSNVWGPVASQFSNASVFLDLNKNRSHDAFAQRIWSFGSSYSSYGIVAHSQGGAASLHLYTYYWSGLDNASGSRLIQSVGTPYQGTPLAGNIALLGQIFGVGCGSNYDLTSSGASAWLAQVPSWARQKVHYFTTSFTDKWWRYDYCNLASDLFLGDPEDGVVERSKGQLPGGNNRGHKTGWCHSSGMRDPGQVTDSSRNASMNANAAR